MLKSLHNSAKGNSLLDNYSRQVVRSQLKRRAETAVIDREICTKNIIELKSYFITNLINKLVPDVEKSMSWARALRDSGVDQNKRSVDQPRADEIVEKLQSMLSLLNHIHDFAELEAGISCVVPETLQIEDIVRCACANAEISAGFDGANKILWNFAPEELTLLGDRDKLIQAFSNIFRFATQNNQYKDKILVTIEKSSELEMAVIIRYPHQEISECEIRRLLSSNNLVEHMIAIGADNIQLAMPIAKGLVELHYGMLAIENKAGEEVKISVTLPVYNTTTDILSQ